MTTQSNIEAALTLGFNTPRGSAPAEAVSTMCSFTRPNDATPYNANDVVTDNSGAARSLVFPNVGRGGLIVAANLVVGHTATADFDLFLFEQEPTNFLDNAALALVATDQPKCIGVFRFITGSKVNMGTNLELYRATSATTDQSLPPIAYASSGLSGGLLYGLLISRSAYTPAAQCKFTARLSLLRNGG